MNAYEFVRTLKTQKYGTEISRADFEKTFYKTKERIEFTFGGWDGKSYDGESRGARIYRTKVDGLEHMRFVKVGRGLHMVRENSYLLEKATGKYHKKVCWIIDVARK